MLKNMSNTGDTFQPIPFTLGFTFSTEKHVSTFVKDKYTIKGIGDQDAIHEHKKLINPLDHKTRHMTIGPTYIINMTLLLLAVQRFPKLKHGLSPAHIKRADQQNWRIAQELCFIRVQNCLR